MIMMTWNAIQYDCHANALRNTGVLQPRTAGPSLCEGWTTQATARILASASLVYDSLNFVFP
jgi:hypothetical protein